MMKPQARWRSTLLLIVTGWCSASLYSTDIEFNNRETCRKEVAGVYLTVYDAWVQARDFAFSLEKSQKEYLAHLQRMEAQLAKVKPEAGEFNLSQRYEQETQVKSRRQLATALAEIQDLHIAAKNREVAAQGQVAILIAALSHIFVQAESSLPRDGYPFRWMYRETCPKFRDNCPLSPGAAAQLATLFTATEYPLPASCTAYVRFSMTTDSETVAPTATSLHPQM